MIKMDLSRVDRGAPFYFIRDGDKSLDSSTLNSSSFSTILLSTTPEFPSSTLSGRVSYGNSLDQFKTLLGKSADFDKRHPFPTKSNRLETIAESELKIGEIVDHSCNTHPIIHENVLNLIKKFLDYKKEFGSEKEKGLYHKMTPAQFIDRLLLKRPLVFISRLDHHMLRDGSIGEGGFDKIGTEVEKGQLTLENYISYEEMPLSALIGVSVPTHFINRGWRYNRGQIEDNKPFEEKGVYIALVGARLEKPGFMEWKHMVITPKQNTPENGYGEKANPEDPKTKNLEIWAEFYGSGNKERYFFPSYEEAVKDPSGRYLLVGKETYLNTEVYKKRIRMSIEPFLLEANRIAYEQKKFAYVHAVGIGLGVWKLSDEQGKLMVDVYNDIIKERNLAHISDIDFSWFPPDCTRCGTAGDNEILKANGNHIKIHFSKRNPSQKLTGEDEGKFLISAYAWDSNSYPGNEYWLGSEYLGSSGDPAAACCSTIAELQNPEINSFVSGENTLVFKV